MRGIGKQCRCEIDRACCAVVHACSIAVFNYTAQLVPGSGFCFAMNPTKVKKTFADATAFCTANGADYLPIVHSAVQMQTLAGVSLTSWRQLAIFGCEQHMPTLSTPPTTRAAANTSGWG